MPCTCSSGYTRPMNRFEYVPVYPGDDDASQCREQYYANDNKAWNDYQAAILLCPVDHGCSECRAITCMNLAGAAYIVAYNAARDAYYKCLQVLPPP